MPDVRWQTAPRASIWAAVDDTLQRSEHRGIVLVGPAGVGKTALARSIAHRHARDAKSVIRWVSATASASHIPFGAFSHLLEVAPGAESAALLRAARMALCHNVDERRMLIAVDDAQHLDALSATLLHQLVFHSQARLLLTLRENLPVPDAITALWKDDLLVRVDVAPLSAAETTTLLESVLGDPLETSTADTLYAITEGNPLFLRHLVEQATATGTLRRNGGVWQLRGAASLSSPLSSLIHQRLDLLAPEAQKVMHYLAIDEPLSVHDLAELTGADAVEQAEAAGVVTVSQRGNEAVVMPAHPLYAECVRAELGVLARRRLSADLVAQIAARDPDHVSDRLRLAALSLDTDTPLESGELITAAWEAMRLGDLALGEVLARGALASSDTLYARLPLAHSLAWQGRGAEADEALAAVDEKSLPEGDLVAWALPKTANQFWMRGESAQARAVLAEVRERVGDPAGRDVLDALAATFALNAGDPQLAAQTAAQVLSSPSAAELAIAWAAATATLSNARLGALDKVAALAERGMRTSHPGLLRFTIGLGQTTASLLDCDVAGAEALARHYLGFAGVQQPGRAIGDILLGTVLMARGDVGTASALLFQSAAALSETGYSWGPLALMTLTQALGQQGDYAQAVRELARAEAAHGMRSAMYTPELELARAWTLAAGRDLPGAVGAARRAVDVAEQTGQLGIALFAVHDAVRLGDNQIAEQATRIGSQLGGALAPLVIAHAEHLAARNAAGLLEVAGELASHQRLLAAADAAGQAAALHAAAGRRSAELDAKNAAAQWSAECGSPRTPALERALTPLPLTGRERAIAVLVAEGLSNKAIAEQLCVSVRTVEGHIYRACTKLGLADRAALASAITAAVPRPDRSASRTQRAGAG